MAVAKEKTTTKSAKNSTLPPSQDLMMTNLVLTAEALAALKAATVGTKVLAAEAATTLKVEDADGGNGGLAIVSSTSLAAGLGVIN